VRVTEIAPSTADPATYGEVRRAFAEAIARWGAVAEPAMQALPADDGSVYAFSAVPDGPRTLADRLGRGALEPDEALDRTMRVAERLGAWHERGVAHGYLRPETVLLDGDEVRLLEPRIHAAAAEILAQSHAPFSLDAYAAPEAQRFQAEWLAADVYALGVLLVHLVVGRPALVPTAGGLEASPVFEALPIPLQRTVAAALHPDPSQRLPGAQKFGLYLRVHRMWAASWNWAPLSAFAAAAETGLPTNAEPSSPPAAQAPFVERPHPVIQDELVPGAMGGTPAVRSVAKEAAPEPHDFVGGPWPPVDGRSLDEEPIPTSPILASEAVGGGDVETSTTEIAIETAPATGSAHAEIRTDYVSPEGPTAPSPAAPAPLPRVADWPAWLRPSREPLLPPNTEEGRVVQPTDAPDAADNRNTLDDDPEALAGGIEPAVAAPHEALAEEDERLAAPAPPAHVEAEESGAPGAEPADGPPELTERTEAHSAPLEEHRDWLARTEAADRKLVIDAQVGRARHQFAVDGGTATVGRADPPRGHFPEIDLRSDDAVSRRHAEFRRNAEGWVIVDLGSTNGTRHNGSWLEALQETPLSDGDEIELGALTTLRVHLV
jgi:FHA domain-containing protein